MDTINIISLLLSTISIIVILVLVIIILDNRRKIEIKDYQNSNIEQSRRYFESKIYDLENELMSNKKRWESVNHLIMASQNNQDINKIEEIYLSPFFINAGIDESDIDIEKDMVFLLTPFYEEKNNATKMVKQICEELNMRCIRGDEEYTSNNIISHILRNILKSRVIIANIDGRNPNVFYELGICHAISKPVIIICKEKSHGYRIRCQ